ncbi:hypothetical protein HDU77_007015 [Chytriomyces hyalinus]|nr:hypothetical protein HDU77_007015 [Chytriomyces hyalinus]
MDGYQAGYFLLAKLCYGYAKLFYRSDPVEALHYLLVLGFYGGSLGSDNAHPASANAQPVSVQAGKEYTILLHAHVCELILVACRSSAGTVPLVAWLPKKRNTRPMMFLGGILCKQLSNVFVSGVTAALQQSGGGQGGGLASLYSSMSGLLHFAQKAILQHIKTLGKQRKEEVWLFQRKQAQHVGQVEHDKINAPQKKKCMKQCLKHMLKTVLNESPSSEWNTYWSNLADHERLAQQKRTHQSKVASLLNYEVIQEAQIPKELFIKYLDYLQNTWSECPSASVLDYMKGVFAPLEHLSLKMWEQYFKNLSEPNSESLQKVKSVICATIPSYIRGFQD